MHLLLPLLLVLSFRAHLHHPSAHTQSELPVHLLRFYTHTLHIHIGRGESQRMRADEGLPPVLPTGWEDMEDNDEVWAAYDENCSKGGKLGGGVLSA